MRRHLYRLGCDLLIARHDDILDELVVLLEDNGEACAMDLHFLSLHTHTSHE